MGYELSLGYYQGPLEKLLELIEARKLEVTQVSLAEVTTDFLAYLEKLQSGAGGNGAPPAVLADFLSVASKLLLIKSKALLPSLELSEEEASDIKNLEARIALYRELKRTQVYIRTGWSDAPVMFTREFLTATEPLFYPPRGLTTVDLERSVARVVAEVERFWKPTVSIRAEMVNLKVMIEEVVDRLAKGAFPMRDLQGRRSRGELVLLFLAVLHLIKQQLVDASQSAHFADITVTSRSSEAADG